MVWALIEPSSFGDFFPDAVYVGHDEQLEEYFNGMPTDFQTQFRGRVTSYRAYVAHKFVRETGSKISDYPTFTPLMEHEKPSLLEAEKSYDSLGSILLTESQLLAVDETLKNIIERLEPGVHTFWPIKIMMPKGKAYPKQYYGLVIGQFKDSFVPEKSEVGAFRKEENYDSYFVFAGTKQYVSGLSMSKTTIGSSHLWRERKLRNPRICLSDALLSEIGRTDLRLPKHFRMQEVE